MNIHSHFQRSTIAAFLLFAALSLTAVIGQEGGKGASRAAGPVPRLADGKPNMQGYWGLPPGVAVSNLLEEHPGGFGIEASRRIITDPPDGKIPYTQWGAAERDRRRIPHNSYEDPEGKCALGGIPHQMFIGRFQILQPRGYVLILHDYINASRHIPLDGRPHLDQRIRLWEGDSVGQWEGATLVVDSTNFNGKPWMALGADFMTENAHVVERFTMADANTINYKVTLEDPKAYTRPWTMEFPWIRTADQDPGIEDDCHEGNINLQHMKAIYDEAHANDKK